ncbi:hypothetical protein [Litorihabitans aurantiacus]|uniref:Uncharacterized protein n=1 Tax=Litorihabitans aurantiacus TaxID=1930061 RepID=A0AA38CT88_9MICO|nr:hypothetical protein [Litorihabitans aurantiacus]GMA31587.1 hypothetical protein GCM10025875_15790 [Litorihabitans aurantiacus]
MGNVQEISAWALDWNAVGAIAGASAAVAAVWALFSAARDSRERSRPDVIVEYRIPPAGHDALLFVVRNVGVTAARNVRLTFDPSIAVVGAGQPVRAFVRDRYSEPIPVLGPGQELTNAVHYDADDPENTDLPEDLRVSVVYNGYPSLILRRSKYESEFELKAAVYGKHTYVKSTDSVEGRLDQIASAADSIDASLKHVAKIAHRVSNQDEADARDATSAYEAWKRITRRFGFGGAE